MADTKTTYPDGNANQGGVKHDNQGGVKQGQDTQYDPNNPNSADTNRK